MDTRVVVCCNRKKKCMLLLPNAYVFSVLFLFGQSYTHFEMISKNKVDDVKEPPLPLHF